jgi:hypothetical protein
MTAPRTGPPNEVGPACQDGATFKHTTAEHYSSVRGYPEAAEHLLGLGLLPAPNVQGLRAMWRLGSHHRAAAELVARRWGMLP